jgi:exodeoxyribonuclease V alpha subunit
MTSATSRSGSAAAEQRAAALVADRWGERDADVLALVRLLVRAGALGHAAIDLSLPLANLRQFLDLEEGGPEEAVLRSLRADPAALLASPAVAPGPLPESLAPGDPVRPLVLTVRAADDATSRVLVQTERAARFELRIAAALRRRAPDRGAVDAWTRHALLLERNVATALEALSEDGLQVSTEQLAAVRTILATGATRRFAILGGGPGTGKTTTVATLLALLVAAGHGPDPAPRIALAAPTGRARSRLVESIRRAGDQVGIVAEHLLPGQGDAVRTEVLAIRAMTVHGLLGIGRGGHVRRSPGALPYDVLVVDETSMLDLRLAAELMDAVSDDALVVFVGDPDQLESVGTGSVLASLIRGLTGEHPDPVARLTEDHRTRRAEGAAREEAVRRAGVVRAVREGEAEVALALLSAPPVDGPVAIEWVRLEGDEDPTGRRSTIVAPLLDDLRAARALALEAAGSDLDRLSEAIGHLEAVRLLCGHRRGPWGVATWNRIVREAVLEAGSGAAADGRPSGWIIGEPVIMTVNDRRTGLSNGDVGILASTAPGVLAFPQPPTPDTAGREHAGKGLLLSRAVTLVDVQSANAITVHRAQGSEYGAVVVLLPPPDSPLANRQLLYTALTRAKERVVLVASEDAVRAAVGRSVRRMGGLEDAVRDLTSATPA